MKKILTFLVLMVLVVSSSAFAGLFLTARPSTALEGAEQAFSVVVSTNADDDFTAGSVVLSLDPAFVDAFKYWDGTPGSITVTAADGVTVTSWVTDGVSVTITGISSVDIADILWLEYVGTTPGSEGEVTFVTGLYNLTGAVPDVALDPLTVTLEVPTRTATPTFTVTPTVTRTVTRTVTPTVTPTITPTVTPFIIKQTAFQPYDASGKKEVYPQVRKKIYWVTTVIDSLSNTGIPVSFYDGDVLLRKMTIPSVPYTIDMLGYIPEGACIIDYGTNTGTSTNIIR